MPTTDSNEELREAIAYLVSDTDRDYASLLQEEKHSVDKVMELHLADREAAVKEARIHENELHLSKFYAASLTDGATSLLFDSIKSVFEERIASLNQPTKEGTL